MNPNTKILVFFFLTLALQVRLSNLVGE